MPRAPLFLTGILSLVPALLTAEAEAWGQGPDQSPGLARRFPEGTVLYVEGTGLSELFDDGLGHPFVQAFFATKLGRTLTSTASPEDWLAFVNSTLGRSALEGLAELTANGVAFGLAGDKEDPQAALVLCAESAGVADDIREDIFNLLEDKTDHPGALDRPHATLDGASFWNIGEALVVQRGAQIIFGNSRDYALAIDACSEKSGERNLVSREGFRDLYGARSEAGLLWAYADRRAIEQSFDTELHQLAAGNEDPAVHTLLGSQLGALATAQTVTAELSLGANELHLSVRGFDTDGAATLLPQNSAPIPPALESEDDLVNGLIYRDFAAILTQGSDLFSPRKVPKLAEAESQLSLFFGGQEVGEKVLPHLSPWLRLISRPLNFSTGPKPEIPLPGLALIGKLEQPERSGPQFLAAFQSIVSVIGVDQAQKQGRPFLLSVGQEGRIPISVARFLDPYEGDGIDMRYNLRPACAIVGDALILGTHEELVRELIRELESLHSPATAASESLHIDGPALAELIQANFEALVMNKVLEDGVSIEKAREEIGGLEMLAHSLRTLRIDLPSSGKDRVVFSLRAELASETANPEEVR
ncbi:MAG: hypothetical protein CMJ89_13935 [Planctomycetes bacterium]|nr:hypothetical protein [Planctomycetota bacterium]